MTAWDSIEQGLQDPTDEPYGSLIGALLFLSVCTGPNIAYAVNFLPKFMFSPTKEHQEAGINMLLYVKGTRHKGSNSEVFGEIC
jgi:hypothetical protein